MDSPLVPVFVAIIAIAALMQAVFVAGLAVALRIANARMAEMQETLDREIAKPVADMARMAEMAVRASEQTLVHARRMGDVVEEVMGTVSRKLQAAGDDLEEAVEDVEEDVIEPARDQLSGVAALFRGVQRAVEVWRETAPGAGRSRRD